MKFATLPEASACQYLRLGDVIRMDRIMIDKDKRVPIKIEYIVSETPNYLSFSDNWFVSVTCNKVPKGIKLDYEWEAQFTERLYINNKNFHKIEVPIERVVMYEKEKKGPWHRLKKKPLTLEERLAAKKKKLD